MRSGLVFYADILNTLFKTPMAVALMIALLLDNTLPGTKEERGLHHWNLKGGYRAMSEKAHWSYDLPFGLSPKVRIFVNSRAFSPVQQNVTLFVVACARLQTGLISSFIRAARKAWSGVSIVHCEQSSRHDIVCGSLSVTP